LEFGRELERQEDTGATGSHSGLASDADRKRRRGLYVSGLMSGDAEDYGL